VLVFRRSVFYLWLFRTGRLGVFGAVWRCELEGFGHGFGECCVMLWDPR
jgi:hypothetical protein